jgi:hypothetical protein
LKEKTRVSDEKDWKMGGSYPGMEPGLGCLHDAHHPDTGAPGLVLTSDERVDWSFQDDWRVSLSCKRDSATVKLLVEEAPEEGEVSTLVNMFVLITSAFSRVEDHSRLQAHLTSKPEARKPGWMARLPLPRNVTGWAFAGLVMLASVLETAHNPLRIWGPVTRNGKEVSEKVLREHSMTLWAFDWSCLRDVTFW